MSPRFIARIALFAIGSFVSLSSILPSYADTIPSEVHVTLAADHTANLKKAQADLIPLLFANQSIEEMAAYAKSSSSNDPHDPWALMAKSVRLSHQNDKAGAIKSLRAILALPHLETRLRLWTWNGLRKLGVQPDAREGNQVLGIVVEVNTENGIDTLAAYADGTARYMNYSGAMSIWDVSREPVTSKGLELLKQAQMVSQTLPLVSSRVKSAPGHARFTLLTECGLRVGELKDFNGDDPLNSVFSAASNLLVAIVNVSEKH